MSGMAIKRNKNKPEIQKTTFFTLLLGLFTVILPSFSGCPVGSVLSKFSSWLSNDAMLIDFHSKISQIKETTKVIRGWH